MAREHKGTMLDADVEGTYREAQKKLARDPRGFILMKLPTWFVMELLNAYQRDRRTQLEGEEE